MYALLAQSNSDEGFLDQIQTSFEDVVETMIDYIPRIIGAIILLLIGRFIAKLVVRAVHALLKKLSFDSIVDKSGLGGFVERAGYPDSGFLLARIVGFIILLIFINLAVDTLQVDAVTDLVNTFIEWIPNVLIAILLVLITGVVANFTNDTLSPTMADKNAGPLIVKVIVAAIWVFGFMMALDQLGFGRDIIDQLWTALTTGLAAFIVIKFGIGGIWAARDRFWPKVYDALEQ
jgi:hypothetical protein